MGMHMLLSRDVKEVLEEIAERDPRQEGIPISEITCCGAGLPIQKREDILERLQEMGYIELDSYQVDITDAGLRKCGVSRLR